MIDMRDDKMEAKYNSGRAMRDFADPIMKHLTHISRMKDMSELESAVQELFCIVGKTTGADRVFLFDENSDRPGVYGNTYEWCAGGVSAQKDELQTLTQDDMPYWTRTFLNGENIVIPDLEEVKDIMPGEYEILAAQDIRSEIASPIIYRGHLMGFIGLDNPASDVSALFIQELAFIGSAIISTRENMRMTALLERQRADLQENLLSMEREQQILSVLSSDSTAVYRVDLKSNTAEIVKIEVGSNTQDLMYSSGGKLCYFKEMTRYYNNFVVKETSPDFLEIFEPNNLMRALADKEVISHRFQCRPNGLGQIYFELRVTRMLCTDTEFQVLVDFRHIDDVVREERQHQEELERALEDARTNNEVISAIGTLYFSIYRIGLKTDYFEEISGGHTEHRLTGRAGKASVQMFSIVKKGISDEYREAAYRFFDLATLAERMGDDETISMEYLAADESWHLARFIVQKRGEDGLAEQVLCVIRLISEEKRRERYYISAAEEANRASEAKSEFLSRMSHDIRTPMNVIMGFVGIAKRHLTEPDKLSGYLDKIEMSGDNLVHLIDDILDISRIESGEFRIVQQPLDIAEMYDFYRQVIMGTVGSRNLNMVFDKHDIVHNIVLGDQLRLGQIYMNLLSNAVKYTPDGGMVRFEVYEEPLEKPGMVRLVSVVSDTGIGMTPEFMKEMYSEFSRAVDTRVNKVRGSGLGLAIVKKIVDLMGGTIEAESHIQHGTIFKVTLDMKYDDSAVTEAVHFSSDEEVRLPEGKVTLLIAEDNDLNYEILAEQLEERGIHCVRAVNGLDCVQKFSGAPAGTFDEILMDMQMPVMNGLEAAARIRKCGKPQSDTIPIIALTANAYHEDVRECMEAGMNAHLSKPVDIKSVLKTVASYLPSADEI